MESVSVIYLRKETILDISTKDKLQTAVLKITKVIANKIKPLYRIAFILLYDAKEREQIFEEELYNAIDSNVKKYIYNNVYHYISENLLAEKPEISVNKAIKLIKKTAESVAKSFDDDDFAFSQKVQNTVFHAVEKQENISPEALADQLFSDNLTARLAFKDQVKEGIPDSIKFDQMPMDKIEKKLANQKLSLSNGIEMIVPQTLYEDAETVEFIQNNDGTYSIIIKNIEEIKNKW